MIQMRMAFALRLVDDFTGQCIRKKGFLFSVEGRVIHPVEKDEGLYLFMEPQESVTRVRIESTDYHSCSVLIEKKQLNPDEPVADVRLYGKPGRGHPYPHEYLTGRSVCGENQTDGSYIPGIQEGAGRGMDLFPRIYKGKSYRKAFYGRKWKRDSKIYSHGKKRN